MVDCKLYAPDQAVRSEVRCLARRGVNTASALHARLRTLGFSSCHKLVHGSLCSLHTAAEHAESDLQCVEQSCIALLLPGDNIQRSITGSKITGLFGYLPALLNTMAVLHMDCASAVKSTVAFGSAAHGRRAHQMLPDSPPRCSASLKEPITHAIERVFTTLTVDDAVKMLKQQHSQQQGRSACH